MTQVDKIGLTVAIVNFGANLWLATTETRRPWVRNLAWVSVGVSIHTILDKVWGP